MPGEKLRVWADKGLRHFAPRGETIEFKVGRTPKGKKIDKLTLSIADRDGKPVFVEVWPGDKAGKNEKGSDAKAPPTRFTWDGADNQSAKLKDREGAEVARYVDPLRAPYKVEVTAELSEAKVQPPPPDIVKDVPPVEARCTDEDKEDEAPTEDEEREAALVELVVEATGGNSKSYMLADALELAKKPVPVSLCVAPGSEDKLAISWKVEHPDLVTGAKLELFDHERVVWSHALTPEALAKKRLEAKDCKEFFDAHLTAADGVAKLKLTLQGDAIAEDKEMAWTYVAVVIAEIALQWGPAKFVPPGGRTDEIRREEVLVLRDCKGLEQVEDRDAADLATLIGNDDKSSTVAVDAGRAVELLLESNLYYRELKEWADDTAFREHMALWGDGPRIPLLCEVKLRKSTGEAVPARGGLKGAQLLWDWEDPKPDKHAGLPQETFLQRALGRTKDDPDGPPSTNCHVDYGGKRGAAATPVFPPQAGTTGTATPGEFPFEVRAYGGRRRWAALSTIYSGRDDKLIGRSGVLFQPSRIAGDTWKVRVYVHVRGQRAFYDGRESLWDAAGKAKLPRAETGVLETWRRLEVLRYFKKHKDVPAIDFAQVQKKLDAARIRLVPERDPDAGAIQALWGDWLTAYRKDKKNVAVDAALSDDQVGNTFGLHTRSISSLSDGAVKTALDNAIAGANRKRDRDRKARLTTAKNEIAKPANQPAWRHLHRFLWHEDLAALERDVLNAFPPTKEGMKLGVASTKTNVSVMPAMFAAGALRDDFGRNMLPPMLRDYLQDKGLVDRKGVSIFHFSAVSPGAHTPSGSAKAVLASKSTVDARRRGLFYVVCPDPNARIEIYPDGKPGSHDEINVGSFAFLSTQFADAYKDDYEGYLDALANAAIGKVLDDIDPMRVAQPKVSDEQLEPEDEPVPSDKPKRKAVIRIKGGGKGVAAAKKRIEAGWKPTIAAVADAKLGERSVYLSRFSPRDKHRDLHLSFSMYSANLNRIDGKQSIHRWVSECYERSPAPIETFYLYYKDTKHGRERLNVVKGYLKALLDEVVARVKVNPDPGDDQAAPLYDLDTLIAHELGHTLFIPHAPPEESIEWRHEAFAQFNCLMNYLPDKKSDEFCGICTLALRGWDIGTAQAPKWSGGGAKSSAPKSDSPPPPQPQEALVSVGWHGTSTRYRASLRAGLKPVEGKWDPSSHGELGPGLYVTRDYETACLYGANSAQQNGSNVDVWEVLATEDVSALRGTPVPTDKQWANITEELCKAPHDYLTNALEKPPVQLKFNHHTYAKLRLRFHQEMTIGAAFDLSDPKAKKSSVPPPQPKVKSDKPPPSVKVLPCVGDGDCFFYAVAFHVKATDGERKRYLDDPSLTYGQLPEEVTHAADVRKEVAEFLAKDIYGKKHAELTGAETPVGEAGAAAQRIWNLCTFGGTDIDHFGNTMMVTVQQIIDNKADAARLGHQLVWCDVRFVAKALESLYKREVIVNYGGTPPLRYGAGDPPVRLYMRGVHYDVWLPGGG